METAERVFSRGWAKMKLYFMIGLPTEQDEDVVGIVETGRKARDVGRRAQKGRGPTVTVSVSTHVPKPHTPFQWCAMDALEDIWRKQTVLREAARKAKVDLKLHESLGSTVEAILARGDRRLADVIETAYRSGARFDSWEERLRWDLWQAALAAHNVDVPAALGTIPVTGRLPWDHLDVGLEDGFLLREYRKALANRLSPPCGKVVGQFIHHTNLEDAKADTRKLVCYDCGVACDLTDMRQERFVYLEQLTARTRPAAKEPVTMTPEERRPRAQFAQGEPKRYRIAFERTGRAAFESHLDLVRLVPRVFRRAELPMFYSQGFHPKPEMMFTPALALGIATLDDFVDVKLAVDVDPERLPDLLNPGAPEGLRFTSALRLGLTDPAISKVIDVTSYVMVVPWAWLQSRGLSDDEAVRAHIAERQAGPMFVLRSAGGLAKRVDVGAYLLGWSVGDARARAKIDAVGYAGSLCAIAYDSKVTDAGAVRPVEVASALLGEDAPVRFIRAAQGRRSPDGEVWSPMSLERLRVVRAERADAAIVASLTPEETG
jgi:radical SAM-linked protein